MATLGHKAIELWEGDDGKVDGIGVIVLHISGGFFLGVYIYCDSLEIESMGCNSAPLVAIPS